MLLDLLKMKKGSIQKDLFVSSISLSFIIIVIFGIFLSLVLYYSGLSNAYSLIEQRNKAINLFIEGYFIKIINIVELLSDMKDVINAPYIENKKRKQILKLYKSIESVDRDINYIYSGYKNGYLLINDYTPPPGFNPIERPWYKAALKSAPNVSEGVPYQEIKTKEWLVSISKVLLDENNNITGVVSIDCGIDKIISLLKESGDRYKSSYSYVIRPDGKILIHPNKEYLGKDLLELIKTNIKFDKKFGKFSYRFNNIDKLAYYSFSPKVKWVIVTVVNKSEIINPIVFKIIISIIIIGMVAILISWFLSRFLSRKFIEPLVELEKGTNAIIKNEFYQSNYKFPDNEIGIIAQNIKLFTEKELYKKNLELKKLNNKLQKLSNTDQLTGLLNRRKMSEELNKEWDRAQRYGIKFSIILFDIDFFKNINDIYGHQMGDKVLKSLSKLVKNTIRTTDMIARWGGEEFLILCPNTNLKEAITIAERCRQNIQNKDFGLDCKVTISLGICEYNNQQNIEDMIKEADNRLYKAKKKGRNISVGE